MASIPRAQLLQDFERLGRESSTATIMFHTALGQRVGLTPVELKCIDVLSRLGAVTAGDLGTHMHLTSGAVTNLVDRLHKRGYVRRERDTKDRRKVIIRLHESDELQTLVPMYDSLGDSFQKLLANYSDKDLQMMHEFMTATIAMMHREAAKIASQDN